MPSNHRFTHGVLSVVVLLGLALPGVARAQENGRESAAGDRPRIFFDCRGSRCDSSYYRTEIDWVTWVRDQRDAHLHVIMTSQQTGAGGREFLLDFMGRESYEEYEAQSRFQSLPTDTEREELDGVALTLGLGFAQFAVESGFRNVVQLDGISGGDGERAAPEGVLSQEEVDDPWNLWVFRANTNGNYDGESARETWNMRGSFRASRVTPTWKQSYNGNFSRRRQEIDFPDQPSFIDERHDWSVSWRVVYSLAERVSTGFSGNVGRNTRNNQARWGQFNPAIEYSFFPYEEATRRSFTAFYEIGPVYREYIEETIYEKSEELQGEQALSLQFSQRQPWGYARVHLRGSSYLHDKSVNNTSLSGDVSFRITRGLELEVGADYSRVRDQMYLAGGGLSQEERLLRLQREATDYEASLDFGLSYQFGSIFNNVVNNRFSQRR